MGQLVARVPQTWQELMDERDRVLHWSSEILARIDDNINNENTFLMDYDRSSIREKVNQWIEQHRVKQDNGFRAFLAKNEDYREKINKESSKISNEIQNKMRKEYSRAYQDVRKFTKRVDLLANRQQKIHIDIQNLVNSCSEKPSKFVRKFAPLRTEVFNNLEASEKIQPVERKLFNKFRKRVYGIDRKCRKECHDLLEKMIRKL